MSDETFWDDAGQGEVVAGRYRLPDPVTGEVRSWTRASNIGAAVADRWALERYGRRQLVRGLAARPDLLRLLEAAVELDNGKVDEVIETALQAAGSTVKANVGTMIHEVQRRVDLGLPVPEGMERYADGYRAALARAGLRVVAVEVLLCNRPLGAMGRADRVYLEADGSWVVGDTKSTAHLDLAQHEIAPQLTTYAHADYLDTRGLVGEWARWGGEGASRAPELPAWERLDRPDAPMSIRRDYALAVHVDRESGAVSLYRVDLYLGGYGANLATQVREWRNVKGILLPYVPPVPGTPEARPPGRHLVAVPDPHRDPAVEQVLGASEVSAQRPDLDPGTHAVSGGLADDLYDADGTPIPAVPADAGRPAFDPQAALSLLPEAELMKLTKAQVQEYGRKRGVKDLAHNKPQLMSIYARAGILAGGAPPVGGKTAGGVARDPAEVSGPIGGEDPTDPRTEAFQRARLAEIAAAPSVADLGRINVSVVRRGGDQAWTDEMTEAARARAAVLDGAQHWNATQLAEQVTAKKIHDCATSEAIAEVWTEVTVGGSAPERWTDALNKAAHERLAGIRAATPPAPANPFAGV